MDFVWAANHLVLLAAHLAATNISTASPLLCIWLRGQARRGYSQADSIGRQLAWVSLWSLLLGIVLGAALVALFLTSNYDGYWAAARRFPTSTYIFAAIELTFSGACLAAYAALWNRWRARPRLHAVVALLGATNLVYHLPPLMIVLGNLAVHPDMVHQSLITRPVFRELMFQPDLFSALLHYMVASVAVSGVAMMLVARHVGCAANFDPTIGRYISSGARIALASTLVQLAVGAWLLVQLRRPVRDLLLGDDWLACLLFLISLVTIAGTLQFLLRVSWGEVNNRTVRCSASLVTGIVVLMTAAQMRSRHLTAEESQFARSMPPTVRSVDTARASQTVRLQHDNERPIHHQSSVPTL